MQKIFDWASEHNAACDAVAQVTSSLKLLLKTKDDPTFIRRWVEHHKGVVGLENIIILDNMSTDPAVLQFYEELSEYMIVIRFSGFHNNVHDTRIFQSLYKSICSSAKYFCFLDTDEYLIAIDDDRVRQSSEISQILSAPETIVDAFAGMWIYNAHGLENIFILPSTDEAIGHNIRWGKPIIRAEALPEGFINHNIQLPYTMLSQIDRVQFLVLHLAHLSVEQRIRANVNKLVARKVACVGESPKNIISRLGVNSSDANTHIYLSELSRLLRMEQPLPRDQILRAGEIELRVGQQISWFSDDERRRFCRFIGKQSLEVGRALQNYQPHC